jgi:hypothetical protein
MSAGRCNQIVEPPADAHKNHSGGVTQSATDFQNFPGVVDYHKK